MTRLRELSLRALAWEARRRGMSYGVLCAQLRPGEEKEILERYGAAMGINLTPKQRPRKPQENWPFDVERAMELYDKGCSDIEISHQMLVGPTTIRRWRKGQGLPGRNPQRFPAELAKAFYDMGLRDDAIADKIGRSEGAVRAWRARENLPVPVPQGGGDGDGR